MSANFLLKLAFIGILTTDAVDGQVNAKSISILGRELRTFTKCYFNRFIFIHKSPPK